MKSYFLLAFFCALTWPACAQTDAAREAELLKQIKSGASNPLTLSQLARVREERGDYQKASATWHYLKRRFGNQTAPNQSSAPSHKWSEIADFWRHRLQRKINLAARPPRLPNAAQRRNIALSVRDVRLLQREGGLEITVQTDLDGDGTDEIFFAGHYGPLGKRDQPFLGIAKLRGARYQVVWRAQGKEAPTIFPYSYDIRDRDGDGWKEIGFNFEPETDNTAMLYFNGRDVLMSWLWL